MNDGKSEPLPVEETIDRFVLVSARYDEERDPGHHAAHEHAKGQPEQGATEKFVQGHRSGLLPS